MWVEQSSLPWWDRDHDYGFMNAQPEPFRNLTIGSNPCDGMTNYTAQKFDVFINVSDTPCNTFQPHPTKRQHMYWYPIAENLSWGFGPFYWAFRILDHHLAQGHKIYLHCHAGMHRSPMIFFLYLYYKGYSLRAAQNLTKWGPIRYTLSQDLKGGHIPRSIFRFIRLMRKMPDEWPLEDLAERFEPGRY